MEHKAAVDINFLINAESDTTNGNEGSITPVGRQRNPLEIAGVLLCVFGFLPLEDIKRCRLVSKEWNHVAEPFLRKLSRISFGSSGPSFADRSLSNFIDIFKNSRTQQPFTAHGIKKFKCKQFHWTEESFMKIFETLGPNIKDLKIDDFQIKGPNSRIMDFLNLFSASQITALNVGFGIRKQDFSFPLDKFVNVKYLRLTRCVLRLINGIRISPVEINLNNCQILFPVGNSDRVINEFISFENMKLCTIDHTWNWRGVFIENALSMDLAGNAELDTLDLFLIEIRNWRISNWKVRKLVMGCNIGTFGNSTIEVNEMQVERYRMSLLDIPKTVEVLSIYAHSNRVEFVSFPNLKMLKISVHRLNQLSDNFYGFLRQIRGPNLVALEISFTDIYFVHKLALAEIPSGLKKLKINGTNVKCSGKLSAQLESIVLNGLSIPSILDIMPKVQTQKVVLNCSYGTQANFKNNPNALKYLNKPYQSFAIGPFTWKNQKGCTKLEKLVDERSEYYLFKLKKASSIEKSEFEKLMEL